MVTDWQMAAALGLLTGGLGVAALRIPLLAWVALAPLGVAMGTLPAGAAALAGSVAGGVVVVPSFPTRPLRPLLALGTAVSATSWGCVAAAVSAIWPEGARAWAIPLVPIFAVVSLLPLRVAGAPRTATNPLARTQERWLPVVHIARLGSDLCVSFVLGTSAGIATLLMLGGPHGPSEFIALALAILLLAVALGFGRASYLRAMRRVSGCRTLKVAAVVCDGPASDGPPDAAWPLRSPEYADVRATIERYAGPVSAAISAGARVLVLPELAVRVDASRRAEWIEAVVRWTQQQNVVIVAPYFDSERPVNELVMVGPVGVLARYEKQHPGPIEPKRRTRMRPGLARIDGTEAVSISTVICVDLDYGDLIRPVARVGGLLAVPANDWPGYEILHHRAAVWSAVMGGTSVLRATGHGISAAFDPAGRVIAEQSSLSDNGPVVLVTGVPV